MATYKDFQTKTHDDFFTSNDLFKQLSKFIPPDKIVSMPFYSPYSKCNEILGSYIDNDIIYNNEDFFKNDRGDIVCDNPPFSIKKDILKVLYERDKPFMLILPVSSMCYKYFRIFKDNQDKLQFLIPKGRPRYIYCNPTTGEKKDTNKSPAFDTIVFCYKMNLKNSINFMD